MGTSTRYVWQSRRRFKTAILGAVGDDAALSNEVRRQADRLCDTMRNTENHRSIAEPVISSTADTTTRLCEALADIDTGSRQWPTDEAALAEFVSAVCGDNDSIHGAAVRRALVTTVEQVDVDARARVDNGEPLGDGFLCQLYQLFHVEVMTEVLLQFMCESVLPGVASVVLRTELGTWAVERVARLLPNPCGEPDSDTVAVARRGSELAETAITNLIEGRETGPEDTA